MTKQLLIPSSKEMIVREMDYFDGVIVGIQGFSVNLPIYFTLGEIREIVTILKENKKEVFVSVNRNFHNQDIEKVPDILSELEQLQVDGVLYYDIGVVAIKNRLGLQLPLVWAQEHMTTNADTCNYWYQFGAHYAYLSNELTLEEILEIKRRTCSKVMVTVFGYLPMFHSKRHLVKNYLAKFSLIGEGNQYYIEKEGKEYPIIDDTLGTTVYSHVVLNALEESMVLKKENVDYIVFDSYHVDPDVFHEMIIRYHEQDFSSIHSLIQDYDKGFLYKETVYRVKGRD